MLKTYPELDKEAVDRQGEAWWECDADKCSAEAKVVDGKVPDGWGTSDPNDDPLQGAAQFCPKHVKALPVPVVVDGGDASEGVVAAGAGKGTAAFEK